MSTMTYTGTLAVVECAECHIDFGMPQALERDFRRDHKSFHCPRGHKQYFPGESDIERANRLEREAIASRRAADARATALRDQLDATERSLRGHKAAKTRIKNRIAAGVCPCCNRNFQNVARHMAGQHPNYTKENEQ